MSAPDRAVEKAADKLDDLAAKAAAKDKPGEKLAPALEDDADFLRTMTPSRVRQRLRTGPPPVPQRRRPRPARSASALPTLIAAFALGVLIAKLVDWRSYAT